VGHFTIYMDFSNSQSDFDSKRYSTTDNFSWRNQKHGYAFVFI